mmetsp:Transcript_1727/g.2335  ORF Transcript_1727/g.2335 Transcript_1727/m.2335 type:complete len:112 (-) Transcript_1727:51-386(-)
MRMLRRKLTLPRKKLDTCRSQQRLLPLSRRCMKMPTPSLRRRHKTTTPVVVSKHTYMLRHKQVRGFSGCALRVLFRASSEVTVILNVFKKDDTWCWLDVGSSSACGGKVDQ